MLVNDGQRRANVDQTDCAQITFSQLFGSANANNKFLWSAHVHRRFRMCLNENFGRLKKKTPQNVK